jgi:hypothetical protein
VINWIEHRLGELVDGFCAGFTVVGLLRWIAWIAG